MSKEINLRDPDIVLGIAGLDNVHILRLDGRSGGERWWMAISLEESSPGRPKKGAQRKVLIYSAGIEVRRVKYYRSTMEANFVVRDHSKSSGGLQLLKIPSLGVNDLKFADRHAEFWLTIFVNTVLKSFHYQDSYTFVKNKNHPSRDDLVQKISLAMMSLPREGEPIWPI